MNIVWLVGLDMLCLGKIGDFAQGHVADSGA